MDLALLSQIGEYRIVSKATSGCFRGSLVATSDNGKGRYIIKQVSKQTITSREDKNIFQSEVVNLQTVDEQICGKLIETFEDDLNYNLVFDVPPDKCLRDYIREKGPLSINDASVIIFCLLNAISNITESGNIIFCNINADNIFVSEEGILSKFYPYSYNSKSFSGVDRSVYFFIPPEIMNPKKVSICAQSDSWSIGVLFMFLITGRFPFAGESKDAIVQNIMTSVEDLSHIKDEGIRELIRKCLVKNPIVRLHPSEMTSLGPLSKVEDQVFSYLLRVVSYNTEKVPSSPALNRNKKLARNSRSFTSLASTTGLNSRSGSGFNGGVALKNSSFSLRRSKKILLSSSSTCLFK